MLKLIDRIFTDKHANHAAIGDNYLLMLMYRFASPFAVFLHRLGMTPNWITTWSLTFSLLAFIALAFDEGWGWFAAFWGMSVLLDFCDGTVARMSDGVSKVAFRYDHMSDLFKIALVILGVGLRYDETMVWLLAFSLCFAFLYSDLLNRELYFVNKMRATNNSSQKPNTGKRSVAIARIANLLSKNRTLYSVAKSIWVGLFTFNGHTLLLFFVFPLGVEFVILAFIYLTLICLIAIRSRICLLRSMLR